MRLPLEQREMLLDIVHKRDIEVRRQEIAKTAKASIAAFHEGELRPQSADEVISELRQALEEEG
jgi:hypothetical protein